MAAGVVVDDEFGTLFGFDSSLFPVGVVCGGGLVGSLVTACFCLDVDISFLFSVSELDFVLGPNDVRGVTFLVLDDSAGFRSSFFVGSSLAASAVTPPGGDDFTVVPAVVLAVAGVSGVVLIVDGFDDAGLWVFSATFP